MFGRSKKKQAPEQMQVSAEALALLQAMQTNQQMQQPQVQQPQQMNRPMAMPSGGPAPRQAIPMPNMNAGIFNVPQFNRR